MGDVHVQVVSAGMMNTLESLYVLSRFLEHFSRCPRSRKQPRRRTDAQHGGGNACINFIPLRLTQPQC